MKDALSIIIVGGGASGVLLATHLLGHRDRAVNITLIEKRPGVGRGVAYSAVRVDHVLNVPASGMSAFPDDPGHFQRWLHRDSPERPDEPFFFAPRRMYGVYLDEVLREASLAAAPRSLLTIVEGESGAIESTAKSAAVTLIDGRRIEADIAVLAVGHEEQPSRSLTVRTGSPADTDLPLDAPVIMLGSGLSMIDAWLALVARQHRGPIRVVSRHGLLPQPHRQVLPLQIDEADVPFEASFVQFWHWFRGLVQSNERRGSDWRSVVDGLRPYNQRIWQSWTPGSRRQFLQHARPWWNIHRHRLPPQLHARLVAAIANGQVELTAGVLRDVEPVPAGVRAIIKLRGVPETRSFDVVRVYDCGGVTVDVTRSSNATIQSLLASGRGRPDPERIGLDVTRDLAVVARDGRPASGLYAVGPLTRGKFFEIEAVPDIRRQCADLAARLVA
ncbi:MAG: FAD/NAD(P)-binding protein [Devosia sp.]